MSGTTPPSNSSSIPSLSSSISSISSISSLSSPRRSILQSSTPRPHSTASSSIPTLPSSTSSSSISSLYTSLYSRSPSLSSTESREKQKETEENSENTEIYNLQTNRKTESFENFETLELPRAQIDALFESEDDLRKELEQVKRSKKEEIWKLNVEMSKLEKSLEETQIKSGSKIQRLEHLVLFETNRTREAMKKYEDMKDKFDNQFRLQKSQSPDNESKYLREKLQSTELYCLEIEEQLERLKSEKNEWDSKFIGIAGELREATANEHEMLILLEEMQKEKSSALESFQIEKSLRASAEEKITILQKQNEFFQRELRKASPSPPSTPPIPRSSTPPLSSSSSSSLSPTSIAISPSSNSQSLFLRSITPPHLKISRNNFRFDIEWSEISNSKISRISSLEIGCVICSSDGQHFREISSSNCEIFAGVQITNCKTDSQNYGKSIEVALDKLGSDDLLFLVLKKVDSSFLDISQVKCDIFGYDKKIGSFPIVNPNGEHSSIVVGAATRNPALSNFLCPNVTLESEWKFYWMALKNNITSNDQLFSLLRQNVQNDINARSTEKPSNDWVDPFVQSLGEFKREIADASEKVSQQWVREDYELQKFHHNDTSTLHRGDTVQVNNTLRLSWRVLPPYSGKIQSSCLIFDAFGRLMGDNNNSANNFGGGEAAIRYESPRVGFQETIIEFKDLPEQCGSMVLVMDTAFDGDDVPREIVCNMSSGNDPVGVWRINLADLGVCKSDHPNRATAMILLSAVGNSENDENTQKGWKLSVIGQVLGGDIPLDGMVGYLEKEIQKNKVVWAGQALVSECRRSFMGLVRNVIGDDGGEEEEKEKETTKRLEIPEFKELAPRLFPSMSSPSLGPDPLSKSSRSRGPPNKAKDDIISHNRASYKKAKRKLLKAEKRELKEALKKEKDKNTELEKEIQNLRSQLSPMSPPTISIANPAETDFTHPTGTSLRRVKSQDPKEEGRLDANSDSLRKSRSYRKTHNSTNNLLAPLSPSLRLPVPSAQSNTYSHNFQLKRTRALSPSLPERKPYKPHPEPVAVEPAVVGSDVDDFLAEVLERKQIYGNIRKLEEGYFLIGTKRLAMQVLSGQLVIRVGGGFMNFEEWVRRFGKREGIIISGDNNA